MDKKNLKILLGSTEGENLEFKEAKSGFSVLGDDGKEKKSLLGYCVAIGNEGGGKLILGVSDKHPRKIVGTKAIENVSKAKSKINKALGIRIEIEELFESGDRVLIISIPGRKKGEVLKFYGIPLMRIGEELKTMDDTTFRSIINEVTPDWSAQICEGADNGDLDENAVKVAKENFKKKNPRISEEINLWSDEEFLDKAKLTIKGKITNTAIILLGKEHSTSLITPSVAQITWILESKEGLKKDYAHFGPPLLINIDEVFKKIRNLKYRYIKDDTLFPEETEMYDSYLIREALNNCIAHQDYLLNSKINLTENESGYLIFYNAGSFLPGSINKVIKENKPQPYYRNKFLADAMVNLNMIDTIGSGIPKMFNIQKEKFFPLPSYNLENGVEVRIDGKVLDMNYARTLARNEGSLTLDEIMLLDFVQKNKKIPINDYKLLKKKGLVEGKYPNLFISGIVAKKIGQENEYLKSRGLKDNVLKEMMLDFIKQFPHSNKEKIDNYIFNYIATGLPKKQKKTKVANLLSNLRNSNLIINKGNNRNSKWVSI